MQVCAQMVEGVTVQGSINRRTGQRSEYLLTQWPVPKCTCVAWAINRNRAVSLRPDVAEKHPDVIAFCKHLEKHYDSLCHYTEAKDGEPLFDGMCPHCSGRTVDVETLVLTKGAN